MQRHSANPDFIVAAHLDLKGVQFRREYLPDLLTDLKEQGANALLVEYEEVFPFENLNFASDPETAWTPEFLREFLRRAKSLGLEVIPLQQCLGHLEYVFGYDELRPFALGHKYPSTLDLFNPDAKNFIASLLRQVLEAHPSSRFIHLGLDEARALSECAKRQGQSVCALFVQYAEILCGICEQYGKTPLIWSDVFENNLAPEDLPIIARLKERAVICTWDYTTRQMSTPLARWGGTFTSRKWLQAPRDANAPILHGASQFLDEMPDALSTLLQPFRLESGFANEFANGFAAVFQADLWTQMGFQTLGTTAVRLSADGPAMPFYNLRRDNIEVWGEVAKRSGQIGIIASSWARGTSWCPPNFPFDLSWPLMHSLGAALGKNPNPFFPGVEAQTVERVFATLGRCREDWKMEFAIADEMEALLPQLQAHRYEWQSAIWMARVLDWQKRASFAVLEVEDFWANHRPVDAEWQRRLDDQSTLLEELCVLREAIVTHFSKRYWGRAFEEWIATLFDVHRERLRRLASVCREKQEAARLDYGRKVVVQCGPLATNRR